VTDTSDHNKRDRTVRRIKVACAALIVVGFLGIVGGGVCERIAMSSPPYADPASGQTASIDFKGQARFVQPMIAKYWGLSVWIIVVAAGAPWPSAASSISYSGDCRTSSQQVM